MAKDSGNPENVPALFEGKAFEALANQALARVMPERFQHDEKNYQDSLGILAEAVLDDDPAARHQIIGELLGSGISKSEFICSYARDTSRYLGDLWAGNRISFVDVTIGVARLQETVRSLRSRDSLGMVGKNGPEVLMIVPHDEDHLIGAFVATEEFEKLGCFVHLSIGQSTSEIVGLAKSHKFDMIGISISSSRTVKSAAKIVTNLRKTLHNNTPILVGGGVTLLDIDVCEKTKADCATSDPLVALEFCDLAYGETALAALESNDGS